MSFNLTHKFNSEAELKKLDYDNDVNILMGGQGITNRMSLQAILLKDSSSPDKQEKEFINFIWQLTYKQLIDRVNEVQALTVKAINRMNKIVDNTDQHILVINKRLQELTKRHYNLDEVIESSDFKKDEKVEYKHQVIDDTIKLYEQRTGEKVDNGISIDKLVTILKSQQDFEKHYLIPQLESSLVGLTDFRDQTFFKNEELEEETERINEKLKAIENDTALSGEERRRRTIEILEEASVNALDAQMTAKDTEAQYVELVAKIQESRRKENYSAYVENSEKEDTELNEQALNNLEKIKPLLPPSP